MFGGRVFRIVFSCLRELDRYVKGRFSCIVGNVGTRVRVVFI